MVFAAVALPLAIVAEEKAETNKAAKPAVHTVSKEKTVSGTNNPAEAFPVICYVEKQDRTITVKAGPKGTVYSVKTRDGKAICENVSLEQLRAQAPELHDFIRSAIVLKSDKADKGGKADAALRTSAIR